MVLRHIFSAVVLLFFLNACGYTAIQKDRPLAGGYTLAAVPVFINRTQETGVESIFTNALKKELYRSGFVGVADREVAPVSIVGTIENIRYHRGAQFTGTDSDTSGKVAALPHLAVLTTEYRIQVFVDLKIVRNASGEEIWQGNFQGERNYLAPQIGTESINSSNALYNHSARLLNIKIMAKDIMSEAYARMTEDF